MLTITCVFILHRNIGESCLAYEQSRSIKFVYVGDNLVFILHRNVGKARFPSDQNRSIKFVHVEDNLYVHLISILFLWF